MQITPKQQQCSSGTVQTGHIRPFTNAERRRGDARLYLQILFDVWSTSRRPAIGNLVQWLVKVGLFREANYLATNFLNEEPSQRPLDGPAVGIAKSLSDDIIHKVGDYMYGSSGNKYLYTKYRRTDKQMDTILEESSILSPKAASPSILEQELQLNEPAQQIINVESNAINRENPIRFSQLENLLSTLRLSELMTNDAPITMTSLLPQRSSNNSIPSTIDHLGRSLNFTQYK